MKKSFRVLTCLFVLSIAFGSVIVGLAQNRPILGGYKAAPTDDPEVQAAAEFAVGEQGEKDGITIKVYSIEKAERQVVAGTNFRLCLKVVKGEDEDEASDVKVLVFKSLQKEYQLKSWEEVECSEAEGEE